MEPRVITLSTDFGSQDPFVGIMKGVILGIHPYARIIDLSHGIPPQQIMAAALLLRHSVPFFPPGTIHVAVVDPGVGSQRRPLLIEAEGCFLIGPDNGIFSLTLEGERARQIIHLCKESYHLKPTSATFHGRDIFAPVAAYLSLGIPPEELGNRVDGFERLSWPEVIKTNRALEGEIIYVDAFGNLITNVGERDLAGFQPQNLTVSLGSLTLRGLVPAYSGGEDGRYIALINSWGLLEISLFKGNAHLRCGAKLGDKVRILES